MNFVNIFQVVSDTHHLRYSELVPNRSLLSVMVKYHIINNLNRYDISPQSSAVARGFPLHRLFSI